MNTSRPLRKDVNNNGGEVQEIKSFCMLRRLQRLRRPLLCLLKENPVSVLSQFSTTGETKVTAAKNLSYRN